MSSDQENFSMPPGMLFRSFLLVAGVYVLVIIVLILAATLLVYGFFPETYDAVVNLDPEEFKQLLDNNAEKVFPPEFYWPLVVINAAVCFAGGYLIAWKASFAKFPHAVFLGIILFVGYLQQAIGSPSDIQLMFVLFMGSSPVAVLFGASQYLGGRSTESD